MTKKRRLEKAEAFAARLRKRIQTGADDGRPGLDELSDDELDQVIADLERAIELDAAGEELPAALAERLASYEELDWPDDDGLDELDDDELDQVIVNLNIALDHGE